MAEPPPPPAPPPPPLPPPPPPAPPVGGRGISRGSRSGSKMRNFNWEAIPQDTVLGKHNIWTAEKKKEYDLDTQHMEELFSRKDQTDGQIQASKRKSIRGMPNNIQGPEMVSILGSKKNMNISIFLKQFKRSVKELVEDIHSGESEIFGTGKLQELLKLLPESGEVKKLLAFRGDHSALSEADQFMVQLVQLPGYEERLKCLVLKEEFPPFLDEVNHSITTMTAAGKELLDCADLHSVIRLVLKTGNYMNAGGYAGSAVGFRMTSLLKLADTKANKPGMNLMHYVVMQAQKSDAALLMFPEQLTHIGEAARIHKQDIESEFQRKVSEVQEAKKSTDKQTDLAEQMQEFFQHADSRITEMQSSLQTLNKVTESVAEYFCEDPSEFKLDECCSIFYSFCERFTRALQENIEREMAEVKRKQKERLQSTAKRRSTATCSSRDKDMDGIALESVLQQFLNAPESHRRSRTPSPSSAKLQTENLPQINQPNKDLKRQSWFINTSLGKENADDKKTEKNNQLWRNSGDRACLVNKEDESPTEKEVQKMREVSQKVLRYQSSRASISSGEYISPMTSPQRRTFQEDTEKMLSVTNGEDATKPLKSPLVPKSPSGIVRRHTISLPSQDLSRAESEEDKFVPGEPENESPGNKILSFGNIGRIKSLDFFLPSPNDGVGNKMPVSNPTGKSENSDKLEVLQKNEESLSSSQQNSSVNEQNNHTKRTSRLITFFKRLGEIGKTTSRDSDSSSVDP
ncbi:FH2 domain-containing protein 1 [Bagarius yarrelli]|uniref:FH2 domain-containing protein 1 n=1 Tax=Bagarius yarrelli TaxID=175774 RepID=A0A556TRU5_BAGYA|nr:FH2 domain-containing protein 1 [Bagarius yarrelli]